MYDPWRGKNWSAKRKISQSKRDNQQPTQPTLCHRHQESNLVPISNNSWQRLKCLSGFLSFSSQIIVKSDNRIFCSFSAAAIKFPWILNVLELKVQTVV